MNVRGQRTVARFLWIFPTLWMGGAGCSRQNDSPQIAFADAAGQTAAVGKLNEGVTRLSGDSTAEIRGIRMETMSKQGLRRS